MDSQVESTSPVEANRLIKEFEKRAKEAPSGLPSKTTRLIEKFEKKSQGIEELKPGNGVMISNIKKVFEPCDLEEPECASNVIPAGATNKLIERFQSVEEPEAN